MSDSESVMLELGFFSISCEEEIDNIGTPSATIEDSGSALSRGNRHDFTHSALL